MKIELFPFQKVALANLRQLTAIASSNYRSTHIPQIVSYTAPTGSGKTIIMSALIESIYYGDEQYSDQNDAIFVWLSDSPQLNEQSKLKIDLQADKIRINQCVIIQDDSFDQEVLDDGQIYFLNTQKLSKSSNLTKHSDGRQYTIWETISNTVREKSDRFYFIIDEAHRGAQKAAELARATTIMQKFLKGSPEDNLPPMPVVIGMTATSARFERLAQGLQTSTTHRFKTTPDEVRASGLLKDRIVISYPETTGNDMAVLQAAADEWKSKWDHWYQYCYEQHYGQVYPILVIQVQNGSGNQLTATDLDECLRIIEERIGERFVEGQVVHAFGEGTETIRVNGMDVHYVEPYRISDDRRIKVVFFKEALSTGWDCPRAETMMSFRRATDYTYIAQLLGRMIRTPMQQHILVDDTLNDVHLYLPRFDENTVYEVVEALKSSEGATIPTDVEAEQMGADNYDTLVLRPTYQTPPRQAIHKQTQYAGQTSLFDDPVNEPSSTPGSTIPSSTNFSPKALERPYVVRQNADEQSSTYPNTPASQNQPMPGYAPEPTKYEIKKPEAPVIGEISQPVTQTIDREAVVKAINDSGLLTYDVRKVRITDYLKSMYKLAFFLTKVRLDLDAKNTIISEITEKIHSHIEFLKASGAYDDLSNNVMQFKLSTQIFDVFGKSIDNYAIHDFFSTTDTDIDRQFRLAETRLGNEGVANAYVNKYYYDDDIINLKIHVIIFAANTQCMDDLTEYAEEKFHALNDTYRRDTVHLPERYQKQYNDIVSDGDPVSEHNFRLPETIRIPRETEGDLYSDHLFVDDSGTVMIKLNGWEKKVIEEEEKQDDFVCWLRNPSKGSWALRMPYEMDGEKRPMFPDFLIIRKDGPDYVVDILEPHNPSYSDNLGKAKGLAEYARQNPGVGRIQLIRVEKDSTGKERPYRLDMSKSSIRDMVIHCASIDELNHIFQNHGFFRVICTHSG